MPLECKVYVNNSCNNAYLQYNRPFYLQYVKLIPVCNEMLWPKALESEFDHTIVWHMAPQSIFRYHSAIAVEHLAY